MSKIIPIPKSKRPEADGVRVVVRKPDDSDTRPLHGMEADLEVKIGETWYTVGPVRDLDLSLHLENVATVKAEMLLTDLVVEKIPGQVQALNGIAALTAKAKEDAAKVCTCHERDSSQRCDVCKAEMEEDQCT